MLICSEIIWSDECRYPLVSAFTKKEYLDFDKY